MLVKLELQEQNIQLRRIADALERMAPPLKAHDQMGRKSDLSDLRVVDAAEREMLRQLEEAFAEEWKTVPGSDAFEKAKKDFEKLVEAEAVAEGRDPKTAVAELLWNRIGRRD